MTSVSYASSSAVIVFFLSVHSFSVCAISASALSRASRSVLDIDSYLPAFSSSLCLYALICSLSDSISLSCSELVFLRVSMVLEDSVILTSLMVLRLRTASLSLLTFALSSSTSLLCFSNCIGILQFFPAQPLCIRNGIAFLEWV